MSQSNPSDQHKWSADRPGELPHDDILGRKAFAQRVAKELLAWRQKDSLVVSLNGDWGSGKTTLANLIVHYINNQTTLICGPCSKPLVVKFNPWQWSGQNKLLEAFFDEIGGVFRRDNSQNKKLDKRLARFWEGLKIVTVAGGELADRLQESLTALAALLAGSSGVLSSAVSNPTGKFILQLLGMVLLAVSAVCAIYAPVAEKLAALFKWKTKKTRTTLPGIREDLKNELEKMEATLLIVIDDIDRLTKREVRMLMQLIKVNVDFPNVVYLLLYQKSIVANALNEITSETGSDFLKKIVQIELEVPLPPDHEMRKFFEDKLQVILKRAEIRWDAERWGLLFESAVWPYFRTPRDIKRFMGMFDFYYEAHINEGILEVNPIDLILLEVLRTFDPFAFEKVSHAFQKQPYVFIEALFTEDKEKNRFYQGVHALLKRKNLNHEERRRLHSLLLELFPQAKEAYSHSTHYEQKWERDLRICHEKLFPRYFQIGSNPGDVTAGFIAKLFKVGEDRIDLNRLLKTAFDIGHFDSLIDRIAAIKEDIPSAMVFPLITALFDLSDSLPDAESDLFSSSGARKMVMAVRNLLQCVKNANDRSAIFRASISTTTAVTAPTLLMSLLEPRDNERQAMESPLIDLQSLELIKSELVSRLWKFANDGSIWPLKMVTSLIYRMRDWSGIDKVKAWLANAIQNPAIALRFLMVMLRVSQISGGGGKGTRTTYLLVLSELSEFVVLQDLAVNVQNNMSLDVLAKAAIETLHRAIAQKAEGATASEFYVISRKPSGEWFTDEHEL